MNKRNRYETVVIFDPDLSDQQLDEEIKVVEGLIIEHQGKVEVQDKLGRRPLAYRISRKDYGHYVLFVFEAPTDFNVIFDRQLRLREKILRHLTVLKDRYAPDISQSAREFTGFGSHFVDPSLIGDLDRETLDDVPV